MPVSLKTWHFYILVTNERAGYPHLNESTFRNISITSQGKSQAKRTVHLNNSQEHRAVYVALSTGTSAASTVIVQGFSEAKIIRD
jgi:hypothetical protein